MSGRQTRTTGGTLAPGKSATTTKRSSKGNRTNTSGSEKAAAAVSNINETATIQSSKHGFLRLGDARNTAPSATAIPSEQEDERLTSKKIDATTNILLQMKNMSDKEIGMNYRDVRDEEKVKQYCKTTLFHWLKFVGSGLELARLSEAHDIGNVVMRGLNVTDEALKPRWWLLYQEVVKKALDTQRSNCNMAIKSVMIGTSSTLVILY
jgi:hypothetical protein